MPRCGNWTDEGDLESGLAMEGDGKGVRLEAWTPIAYPSFPDSVNERGWTRKVGEMGRKPRASSGGTTSSSWIRLWTLPCAGLPRRCTATMESTLVSA